MSPFDSALGHLQQERGDPLLCVLATEQQHVVLRSLQVRRGLRPELARHFAVVRRQRQEGASLHHQDPAVADRLGGEACALPGLQAEHVAGQVEGADLAAAVAHQLGSRTAPLTTL